MTTNSNYIWMLPIFLLCLLSLCRYAAFTLGGWMGIVGQLFLNSFSMVTMIAAFMLAVALLLKILKVETL